MHNFIKVFDAPITFKVFDEHLQEVQGSWSWVLTTDGKLGFVIEAEGLQLVANPKGWLVEAYCEGNILYQYNL